MPNKARDSFLKDLRGLSGTVLLLCGAQVTLAHCRAEAKLLVSPSSVRTSVAALRAGAESRRQIYLYDTDDVDLLSHGVILRLRTGALGDLTVKLRWDNRNPRQPGESVESMKCEVDVVGSAALSSYSLGRRWKHESIPRTGEALYAALSGAQRRLLATAGIAIDWHRVKRIVQVRATEWQARGKRPLNAVSVEFWEWPSGKVLELSAKADNPKSGQSTLDLLRQMALGGGLIIQKDQEAKTSIVLHAVTTAAR